MSFTAAYRQLLADARPGAQGRSTSPTPAPHARLHAWLRQTSLERRLLDGESVEAGGALAVRAWQLTHPRTRAQVARTLSAVLTEADEPRARCGAAVPVRRAEVTAAREEIVRVVERLREPRSVRPRGVAMLRRLLCDGDGPLYAPVADDELWRRLRRAAIALD